MPYPSTSVVHEDARLSQRVAGAPTWGAAIVFLCLAMLSGCSAIGLGGKSESDDLRRARRIVDRGVAVLEENPDGTWETVKQELIEVMGSEEIPYLDDEETEALREYIDARRQRVQPIIERVNASRKLNLRGRVEECTVYCVLFFLSECETDCPVGLCLGIWDCDAGVTVADCDECVEEADSPCTDDGDCPPGYRCAKWLFKKNECVKPCEDDSDCPAGEKCKRPFGTRFRRCK